MSISETQKYDNLVVVANALETGCNVIKGVAGNAIADGFDGGEIDRKSLADALSAKLNGYLRNQNGA